MGDGRLQRLIRRSNDVLHFESVLVDFESRDETHSLSLGEIGMVFYVHLQESVPQQLIRVLDID